MQWKKSAMVKINEQTTLNVISVYFPKEPEGDNRNWLKNIALSNKRYVIVGDFNAHAPVGENRYFCHFDSLLLQTKSITMW